MRVSDIEIAIIREIVGVTVMAEQIKFFATMNNDTVFLLNVIVDINKSATLSLSRMASLTKTQRSQAQILKIVGDINASSDAAKFLLK